MKLGTDETDHGGQLLTRLARRAGVSATAQHALATDDEQERRLRVLLLDEGSTATTDKAEGCRWGRSTYPARSISILCRDAEVPRCWSLGIAC
jgi:hypothetical protein